MGGGEYEKEEDWTAPSIAGAKLINAPILFFVVTHKAFRAELASIHHVAAEAAESGDVRRELLVDLARRLEFLKLVSNYHSVAEDEVIFLALDAKVKNVVPTYSLEHSSIEVNFNCIFDHLDGLMKKDEGTPEMFQALISSISTVQAMICHHMHKEEEQVFPLLMEKITAEEQSQLVWQYMCSVPIMILEEFLPWMILHLTSDEKLDVLNCITLIIPKERLLQEVVISWIQHEDRSSSDADIYGKGYRLLNGLSSSKDIHKLFPLQLKEPSSVQTNDVEPIKGIYFWHASLRRDLYQIIEELYQIRSSNSFSSLPPVIAQLKFIADVLVFYSNSLDKIFNPLLNLLSKNNPSPFGPLIDECHIKGLQRFLFYEHQGSAQLRSFVEMLCQELESLVSGLRKNLMLLETEVFVSISESCTREMQLWLLYTFLHMMPLGLLRCTVTWFSAHLTENQSNSVLKNMKPGCPSVSNSFSSILYEWVRAGCSGKMSIDRFRQNLEEMFNGRSFYLAKQNRQETVLSDQVLESDLVTKTNKSLAIPSSSVSTTTDGHDSTYPSASGMNLHLFFSQMFKKTSSLQKNLAEPDHATSLSLESRPMDLIFYIHRGLLKDLDYLLSLSAKLGANLGFLSDFKKCFKLLRIIYQIHSTSEDEIAFPALESKGALQNISSSYCIDHKLENIYFSKTSKILEEICELHDHEGSIETRLQLYKLCLKLHETCMSMHKVLSDHIHREEFEIFPLFIGRFSTEEEEKIVGHMLGRTGAEILQDMIPWLMAYLTSAEQHAMMSLWLRIARYTKFDEWLREWWEGTTEYYLPTVEEGSQLPSSAADPLEVVSMYLLKDGALIQRAGDDKVRRKEFSVNDFTTGGQDVCQSQDLSKYQSEVDKKRYNEVNDIGYDEAELQSKEHQKLSHQEHPLSISEEELEAAIGRVSRDSNLDSEEKSRVLQSLLMSPWIMTQKTFPQEASEEDHDEEIPGQCPSYRDHLKLTFGCKHYKRNCKLLAPCCNKLFTCIRCHDDLTTNHSVDRKAITKMMCMKCLVIQPIGPKCMSESCSGFSMGKYYCRICKLFDDERIGFKNLEKHIYHCPYCNLCRVGKGLGIDYFHCMKCNACMSTSLYVHVCREKCLEDNCPICHEYIFTSNSPFKQLPCGHFMHSSCFRDYTCSSYICPICSKSLGDMQVYFGMLDALLAEEKTPEEYAGQVQVILCNDCEKRGNASFHWLYHKCPYCGSYNTRLL
ncbi:hypothetical protein ACS0TY_034416 [Phlomoides rotata]